MEDQKITYYETFKTMYFLMAGDFEEFWKGSYPESYKFILFFLSTMIIMITLLNLLIVVINETYDKVDSIEVITQNREKCFLIRDIEKVKKKILVSKILVFK